MFARNSSNNSWNANSNGNVDNNNWYNGNRVVPVANYSNTEKAMELQTLIDTYFNDTLPNKRKSHDSVIFEMNLERNLVKLCNDINARTFQPTACTFIVSRPVTREVFAGDMAMRIVQHYVEKRLRPIMEEKLIPTTFNNRIGKGSIAAANNVFEDIFECSNGYTEDCWIIKVDMKGYFPNADQDIAYHQLEKLLIENYEGDDMDDLLYLLRASIYAYPTLHCTRKTPICEWINVTPEKSLFKKPFGIGGAIGHLIWQCAMTYYISDICHWLAEECGLRISVYMDDIVIITKNKEVTLSLIPELRRRLSEIGVTLHPKKFYCQHYSKGVEFIGHHMKNGRIYVNNRCYRNAVRQINWFNRRPDPRNVHRFISSMNSYLGLFKACAGRNRMKELLGLVNNKWWDFVVFDESRCCVNAREEFTQRKLIIKNYQLKDYGRKRKIKKRNQRRGSENSPAEELPVK